MDKQDVDLSFLAADAVTVARQLIGWRLFKHESSGLIGGTISETEAYLESDAASHSHNGKTTRNEVMFGSAAHVYVYFTYGMHHCLNIVTGESGNGQAVLIRGIIPTEGIDTIRQRRNNRSEQELTNGPAKVCQALGVTLADDGTRLNHSDLILLPPNDTISDVIATKRIGITKDAHRLWRFIIRY